MCERASARAQLLKWDTRASDVDGCTEWHSSRKLQPRCDIFAADAPVLALVDCLLASGFVPRDGTVVHDGSEGLVFDRRAIIKKLYYLQAVLKAEALRALGGPTFDSAKSAAWYKLLLRYPAQCTEELSAAQCKAILRGDVPGEAVPRKRRRLALPTALGPPGLLAAAAVEEDGEVAGDLLPAPLAIADAAEADEASARSTSPRSSSNSSSRSMSDEIIGDAADEAPKRILGQRVWVEKHRGRKDVGWRVQCSQPDHPRCRLYKSVAQARKQGHTSPALFLEAWLWHASIMAAGSHAVWRPTTAQVHEYLAERDLRNSRA